ncbi:hypothetical protein ACN47E_000409 [Coniothyrium glycines]
MDTTAVLRALLRHPATHRSAFFAPPTRPHSRTFLLQATSQHQPSRHLSLPTIIRPSFWASMVPKPLRAASEPTASAPAPTRKPWNPYTPYIILSLLVGSQAIQILWLKQERGHSLRRAEAQIGILKEVIERVQRGEEVDVEGLLGTGDEGREGEWKDVMGDVKGEESLFQSKKRRRALREATKEEGWKAVEKGDEGVREKEKEGQVKMKVESIGDGKFY